MEPRAPRSNDALAQLVLDSLRPRPASLGRGEVVARLLRQAQWPGFVLLHLRPPELLDHVRPSGTQVRAEHSKEGAAGNFFVRPPTRHAPYRIPAVGGVATALPLPASYAQELRALNG